MLPPNPIRVRRPDAGLVGSLDISGVLRRIRRRADLSQRQLAHAIGVSQSAVARAESGAADFPVGALERAAALVDLQLVLVDAHGVELVPMADAAVRDGVGRRFPAHLDTWRTDEKPGRFDHRLDRPTPWFTFDRDRRGRDAIRRRKEEPDDHRLPQPDDDPQVRRTARRQETWRRQREEWERRLAAGEVSRPAEFECTCPPECDELDEGLRPVHTDACRCRCDID